MKKRMKRKASQKKLNMKKMLIVASSLTEEIFQEGVQSDKKINKNLLKYE